MVNLAPYACNQQLHIHACHCTGIVSMHLQTPHFADLACMLLRMLSFTAMQECNPTKKAMIKKMCKKKCALTFETPKVITGISEAEQPNPSKPPTATAIAAETQLPSLDLSKSLHLDLAAGKGDSKVHKGLKVDLSASQSDASLSASAAGDAHLASPSSVDGDLSMTTKVTMDASQADALVPATSGRRLQGLIAQKAAEAVAAANLVKSLPVPACDDVCEDVHFEVPDLECHEVTHTVQSCSLVPEKTCEKECVCIPQKTIAVNLPQKPTLSIKQDN